MWASSPASRGYCSWVSSHPGDPVTGHTQVVRHKIETNGARPVRCGPRHLAPAVLQTEQDCVRDMLEGGQIEPSDSPWACVERGYGEGRVPLASYV